MDTVRVDQLLHLPLQHPAPQLTVLFAHPLVKSAPIAKPELSGRWGQVEWLVEEVRRGEVR